MLIALPWSGI
jgi:hypothetical protein